MSRNYQNHPQRYPDVAGHDPHVHFLMTTFDIPAAGRQPDGSIIEHKVQRGGTRVVNYVRHPTYMAFVLKRQGGNKARLLARAFIGCGAGTLNSSEAEFKAFCELSFNEGSYSHLHALYDQYLAPEHRYQNPPHLDIPRSWSAIKKAPWCSGVDDTPAAGDSVFIYVKPEWLADPEHGCSAASGRSLGEAIKMLKSEILPEMKVPPLWFQKRNS